MIASATTALAQAGLEQYCYWQEKGPVTLMPIVHIQGNDNWYGEARYNYEALGAFSLYAGKTYAHEGKSTYYSVTPIFGAVMGTFKGASLGLNTAIEYNDVFVSSQSQYTFSPGYQTEDFLYSWAEIGYEPNKWFYFGFSVQYTKSVHTGEAMLEKGALVGFNVGRWSFPVYGFNILDESRYFILGINLGLGLKKKAQ
jgi:predicted HicB family RNase H-like nuclease